MGYEMGFTFLNFRGRLSLMLGMWKWDLLMWNMLPCLFGIIIFIWANDMGFCCLGVFHCLNSGTKSHRYAVRFGRRTEPKLFWKNELYFITPSPISDKMLSLWCGHCLLMDSVPYVVTLQCNGPWKKNGTTLMVLFLLQWSKWLVVRK